MPSPEVTRKRGREGGADDARPHKRRSLGASASASTAGSNSAPAAAAAKSDPPALTGPPDGHRRYDEWKGVMYGYEKIVKGNGAMFPTNYQIDFNQPEPWMCPMGTCRKPFPQPAQLGAHFSRAHRKLLLVEEIHRGFFWEYGERKNPDKDGKFRSIVVHREFFEPPEHRRFGRDRQPPEDWEMYINPTAVKDFRPGAPRPPQDAVAPAAPSSTTSSAAFVPRPSAAPVTATPRSDAVNATAARPSRAPVAFTAAPSSTTSVVASSSRPSTAPATAAPRSRAVNAAAHPPRAPAALTAAPPVIIPTAPRAMRAIRPPSRSLPEIIDLSNDNEDVKPVVKDTQVRKTASHVPAQKEPAEGNTSNNGTVNRVQKISHDAMFEVDNPQELGGAQHARNILASWKQEADKDGLSKSNHEDDDDSDPFDFEPSDLPVLHNKATLQEKTGTDTSPIVLADSKQPFDPSKSAIWRYLMTLTKTEIPVPDDPAIIELLTLPKRRNLPRTWQRRLSTFREFQLNTLSGLVLYIGGDEASSSPCEWMGCSAHTDAHIFWAINFYHGTSIDHRFPFPKCVFLPNHLHHSVPISERLGHHLCCNAFYRSRKGVPPWKNVVPNESLEAARDAARMDVMQNTSTNKSTGTELSTSIPGNMPNSATSTSKTGNNAVQPSPSQASLPACSPLQPATMVRDTTTPRSSAQQATSQSAVKEHTGNKSGLESSPVNPNVGANRGLHDVRNKIKEKKTKREATRQKEDLGVEERHSSTSQAQGTLVSSAAASLSNLTVQDASTAPSTSQQQIFPENSQEAAISNPTNTSPQFLGLQGEETQLLQASRRHTLECTVVAGSMKVKTIKNGGMAITSRVNAGETWTVDPDSQCLVSNFFPAAQEVAVLKVKSKPVLASKE